MPVPIILYTTLPVLNFMLTTVLRIQKFFIPDPDPDIFFTPDPS
jgi:hypothetical protein